MSNPAGIHLMALKDTSVEDGALEMSTSPGMKPYLENIDAAMTGRGSDAARKALRDLPVRERYLWRIASSLKQAFCDFDKSSVRADLSTMNAEEFDAVVQLIDCRVLQFAMLLRTVFGAEEMQRMLLDAVEIAKRY